MKMICLPSQEQRGEEDFSNSVASSTGFSGASNESRTMPSFSPTPQE